MVRSAFWLLSFLIGSVRAAIPVATDLSSAWQDAQDAVDKSPVRRVHHSTSEPLYPKSQVYGFSKAGTALIMGLDPQAHSVSFGSGFYVNGQGYLLTNAHVIQGSKELRVYVNDRESYAGRVVAVDEDLDLAALRIDRATPEVVPLAKAISPEGTEVIAVGYPRISDVLQMTLVLHPAVIPGTISDSSVYGGSRRGASMVPFVHIVAQINTGNSGGPLIDTATGRVLGIMTNTVPYIEQATDGSGKTIAGVRQRSGSAYAVPVETIRPFLVKNKIEIAQGEPVPVWTDRGPSAKQYFTTGELLVIFASTLATKDVYLYNLAATQFRAALKLDPNDTASMDHLSKVEAVLKLLNEKTTAAAPQAHPEVSKSQQ